MKTIKLFTPGPVDVKPEILEAMNQPMITHRSKEYSELHQRVTEKLKRLLFTENNVILSTSSASGLMEGAIRNCVKEKCLNLVCGAFGERWCRIAESNGKICEKLEVKWGDPITPDIVKDALSTGVYDAVALTHNETSTGVMNPLKEICDVVKNFDVTLMVDTVSSMAGVKIEVDKWGIDICLASVQKCFALPPGLALCSISDEALKKAETMENRGYYFDFLEIMKYHKKNQTPATPCIPLMWALDKQMDRIFEEGLENRFKRHEEMGKIIRKWAKKNFDTFAKEGYESNTVTTVTNTSNINVENMIKKLIEKGYRISNGYGKLKDATFRIAHMGDTEISDVKELLDVIDEVLNELK